MSRELLTADRTYYVRTDGDDDNTGLANAPACAWLTIQHAANWIMGNIDAGGYQVTVKVGPGTYSAGAHVFGPFAGGNPALPAGVVFSGDVTTPGNVVISTTNGNCFVSSFGARYCVEGFKLTSAGSGDGIYCSAFGQVYVSGAMESGAIGGGSSAIHAGIDGFVVGCAPWTVSGNANVVLYGDRGKIEYISSLFTMVGNPHFAAFAYGHGPGGLVYINGNTYAGSATGWHAYADINGAVDTVGLGVIALPGSLYMPPTSGGQYN